MLHDRIQDLEAVIQEHEQAADDSTRKVRFPLRCCRISWKLALHGSFMYYCQYLWCTVSSSERLPGIPPLHGRGSQIALA